MTTVESVTVTASPDAPTTRRRAVLPSWTVAYGLPVAVSVVASRQWFSRHEFLASGDIPPFIRDSLAHELTDVWNHQATGARRNRYPCCSWLRSWC